ncbi:MAG: hypothetical protein KDE51_23870 [Anaerolineales bacterium]|nr:hypothetical protein [Anaerolineales bacterium]
MSHLATIFPRAERLRLPVSRDQAMLLLAAVNEIFLGLDTYLAHVLNGTILTREWVPILFGPIAGVLLLVAGLLALKNRPLASTIATLTFVASIVVGMLGAFFHVVRGGLPTAPLGQRFTVELMIWAPPIFAPFAFALVGVIGISAAWVESPADSGRLKMPFGWQLRLPYSKTQAYFWMVAMGILISVVSSTLDHVRHTWETPLLWTPTVVGIFALIVTVLIGWIDRPHRGDLSTYLLAMILMLVTGLIGAYFHIQADLTSQSVIVPERFLRGAPLLGPLLYCNMGLLGLIVLLDSEEDVG